MLLKQFLFMLFLAVFLAAAVLVVAQEGAAPKAAGQEEEAPREEGKARVAGEEEALSAKEAAPKDEDLTDLESAFYRFVRAFNEGDLEASSALMHDQIVTFSPNAPFPTDGKEAWRLGAQRLVEENEKFVLTPLNTQYRVVDHVGLVWGYYAVMVTPKGGKQQTLYFRFTHTYVKSGNEWLRVLAHVSPIQAGEGA